MTKKARRALPSPKQLTKEQELEAAAAYATRLKQLHEGKRFHAKQREVLNAIFEKGYKRIFIRKGRKGGGTHTILYPAVRLAGCFDNMACYIIGPQYNLQREIVWNNNRLRNYIPREWNPHFKEFEARVKFPNGSFIKVQGADNYKSMVGIEGDLFIFDEMKDHDPRAYKNCYPNVASRDATWIVCGAPPKNKSNFYYKLEQEIKDDPDWYFIHWSTWDNAEFLPGGKEWIQNEKETYYRNGNWDEWETEWEAKYVFGGKLTVLSSFRSEGDNAHVIPTEVLLERVLPDARHLRWFQVFDPGFATCFGVLFGCYNPFTSEVFFLDEIYETDRSKLSVNDIWPRVQEKERLLYPGGKWKRVYDSAAPGFPQEVNARWGRPPNDRIGFQPTFKEKDDEDKYFRVWNGALATNRCWVASRCSKFIFEMENYLTNEDGTYPDAENHLLDCARYAFKALNFTFLETQDVRNVKSDISYGRTFAEDMAEERKQNDIVEAVEHGLSIDDAFDPDAFDFGFH